MTEPLGRAFFERPTATVARELLGKLLVRPRGAGDPAPYDPPILPPVLARIVEVEAYLGERDAASHARRGPTPRAAIMFGPAGHVFVYLIYGMHHCMNFVTERDGTAGAVLIRAAEPLSPGPALNMSGPGRLCAALGITLADNGLDLTTGAGLFVADSGDPPPRRAVSPRIGVDYAGAWAQRRLRFYVRGNRHVSGRPKG